jgi:hypothetical protein
MPSRADFAIPAAVKTAGAASATAGATSLERRALHPKLDNNTSEDVVSGQDGLISDFDVIIIYSIIFVRHELDTK